MISQNSGVFTDYNQLDEIIRTTDAKKSGTEWLGHCPAHDDSSPSLSFRQSETGKLLFRCHAGCSQEAVLRALNNGSAVVRKLAPIPLKESFKLKESYIYQDYEGRDALRVDRLEAGGKKTFRQFHKEKGEWKPGGTKEKLRPYKFEEWKEADQVLLVEGEKCQLAAAGIGVTATCIPGGAKAWKPHYAESFKDKLVFIFPDNDQPGREFATQARSDLEQVAKGVAVVELPALAAGDDIADWIEAGGTKEQLLTFCDSAQKPPVIEWPEIVPLDEHALPKHPVKAYPEVIRRMIEETARFTETPVEMPALLALATLSTASAGKFIVEVKDGYREPVNLYVAPVLDSGNRKSANVDALTQPLRDWEIKKADELEPEIKAAKSKKDSELAVISGLRQKLKQGHDPLTIAEIADLEAKLTDVPKKPSIFSTDITPEKLADEMRDNGERFALISDEAGIFNTFLGQYSGGMVNLDLLLKGHAGSPVKVHRKNGESIYLKKPALTIAVSPQPDALRSLAKVEGIDGRGVLARFLYVMPTSLLGYRKNDTLPIPLGVREAYGKVITDLLDLNILEAQILRLEPAAQNHWQDFVQSIEPRLRDGEQLASIRAWASKLSGAAVRIAGLIHLAQNPTGLATVIQDGTMLDALEIAEALIPHALAAFGDMRIDPQLDDAKKVFRWIVAKPRKEFTQSECHKALQFRFQKVDRLEAALKLLESRHIIRELPREKTHHRPSKRFEVNPAVFTDEGGFHTFCIGISGDSKPEVLT